jgi:diguanylate cyclase (GGDEF)-like protein
MRFVRRASLVFSLTLIVAIAVGFFVRTSELNRTRDLELRTAAEVEANELASMLRTIRVAATTGVDAEAVAAAITVHHAALGVCVVPRTGRTVCDGTGTHPEPDTVATLSAEADAAAEADGRAAQIQQVTVYDGQLTVLVRGDDVTVVARAGANLEQRDDVALFASTLPPAEDALAGIVADGDIRQTAMLVAGSPGLYVVASTTTDESAILPVEEQRFYLIVFALSVVLLLLAGVTIVVEHRTLIERASIDPLTRLPNRGEFERLAADVLVDARRRDENACLMMFDLNGFKQINDTHGHNAGDEMLRVIAQRLDKAVRDERDIVARWGGDEFVVVLPAVETEEMCHRRARQLADQVGGRTRIDGVDQALRVKVSVGIARWPEHGDDLATLVDAADRAMYEAKREGTISCMAGPAAPSNVSLV